MISWLEKNSKVSWMIVFYIGIFIFYVSSRSFYGAPSGGYGYQTILYHFYAFFFLACFLLIALIEGDIENKRYFIIGILIVILYAISDEFHQLFVANRRASFGDVLIDVLGILVAGIIYLLLVKIRNVGEDVKIYS